MANICFGIFLTVTTNCLLTSTHAESDSLFLRTIFIRLYKRDGTVTDMYMGNGRQLLPRVDNNKQVMLYIHGYFENAEFEDAQLVANAYLMNTDSVVLVADYRGAATLLYHIAVEISEDVGKTIANILNNMVKSGLDPRKLHIIGHSLGSQVAGFVGRNTNFRVPRITALDPAGPLFYTFKSHLRVSDAEFVDIIHTDMGFNGLALAIGHVDFFPNFGYRPQPGCGRYGALFSFLDICSHIKSYEFYVESIRNPNAFVGVRCAHGVQYKTGTCNQNQTAVMGYATTINTRGSYFLRTNAKSPYGRAIDGINLRSAGYDNLS